MTNRKALNVTYNSVFIVLSIVLGFIGRISIFPVFPFLQLDFSDIPIFLSATISGISSGVTVWFISALLRAVMYSSSGWIGFIIRSTSLILVMGFGLCSKYKFKLPYKIMFISILGFVCLFAKLLVNWYLWIEFFNLSPEFLNSLMFTVIVPYNIIKIILTSSISILLEKPINKLLASITN
ncbi:MAG: ECF transporter S component [Acutalibacteraceae bacterium]